MANIIKDFFVYAPPVAFSNIPVGGSQTQQINIQADSSFELQKLTFLANQANAVQTYNTRTAPNLSILITDTGSGRQLMNVPVPVTSLFGFGGGEPFILPAPKVFSANSLIQIQVFNFDAAVATYQLFLSLIGQKVYQL